MIKKRSARTPVETFNCESGLTSFKHLINKKSKTIGRASVPDICLYKKEEVLTDSQTDLVIDSPINAQPKLLYESCRFIFSVPKASLKRQFLEICPPLPPKGVAKCGTMSGGGGADTGPNSHLTTARLTEVLKKCTKNNFLRSWIIRL